MNAFVKAGLDHGERGWTNSTVTHLLSTLTCPDSAVTGLPLHSLRASHSAGQAPWAYSSLSLLSRATPHQAGAPEILTLDFFNA